MTTLAPDPDSLFARLAGRHIALHPDGCWLVGRVSEYPMVSIGNGERAWMHRLTYALVHGPIPDGLVVDHACHNADKSCPGGDNCWHRRCINPAHLRAVTRGENNAAGRLGDLRVEIDPDDWIATVDLAQHLGRIPAGAGVEEEREAARRLGRELARLHPLLRAQQRRRRQGYLLADLARYADLHLAPGTGGTGGTGEEG